MVYYLRPSGHKFHSPSHSNRYRMESAPMGSMGSMGSMSSMSSMSNPMSSSSSSKDDVLEKITPYLVLTVIVAAVTAVVVLQGVKPSENCAQFLTKTEDDGTVKVSPLKVTGLSVGVGLLVSVLAFAVHSLQPSLLDL